MNFLVPFGRDGLPSRPSEALPGEAVSAKPPYQSPSSESLLGRDGLPSRPPEALQPTAVLAKPPYQSPHNLPIRKHLPHSIPAMVADGTLFFITINCTTRDSNQLAHPTIATAVVENLSRHQEAGDIWVYLLMLMPDHLHGLFSFSREVSMRQIISSFKRFTARHSAIRWQRDFFDHRIRNDASREEKWHYIRNNPVRKGLVQTPDEWPFQWHYGLHPQSEVLLGRDGLPSRPPEALPGEAVSAKPLYQSPSSESLLGRDGLPSRPPEALPRAENGGSLL